MGTLSGILSTIKLIILISFGPKKFLFFSQKEHRTNFPKSLPFSIFVAKMFHVQSSIWYSTWIQIANDTLKKIEKQ